MRILITGGTGSFGQAFVKRFKEKHDISILSNDEHRLVEMEREYPKLKYWFRDIKYFPGLPSAFKENDYIIHAAALKHVPVCENSPMEAIDTNIIGTVNTLTAAKMVKVKNLVTISSDKAVNPINMYGATKMVAEKLTLHSNYSVIRFGNFIGARGSVIPLFQRLVKEGKPLPITNFHMGRFFISLKKAVEFTKYVLSCDVTKGIYIPRMKEVNIKELAFLISPNVIETFPRPGEKIREELFTKSESVIKFKDYWRIL